VTSHNGIVEIRYRLGGSYFCTEQLIRLAEPRDLLDDVAVWHGCGLVMPGHDPANDFKVSLRETDTIVLVAVTQADVVVGTAMAERTKGRGFRWYLAWRRLIARKASGVYLSRVAKSG
jgi:hypothetical protein